MQQHVVGSALVKRTYLRITGIGSVVVDNGEHLIPVTDIGSSYPMAHTVPILRHIADGIKRLCDTGEPLLYKVANGIHAPERQFRVEVVGAFGRRISRHPDTRDLHLVVTGKTAGKPVYILQLGSIVEYVHVYRGLAYLEHDTGRHGFRTGLDNLHFRNEEHHLRGHRIVKRSHERGILGYHAPPRIDMVKLYFGSVHPRLIRKRSGVHHRIG